MRVSFVMSYTSKVDISFTVVTSSYEEIGDDDDDDDSNDYTIQLLFSNVLSLDSQVSFHRNSTTYK